MKKAKIRLGFQKLTDAQLQELSNAVETHMTGNANFPEPRPALAEFTAANQRYQEALSASKTRDTVKVAMRKKIRQDLELLLNDLSVYVGYIANGDRSILASSGFSLNTESSTPKVLDEPSNFTVGFGNRSGEISLKLDAVRHAKSYLFLWAPNPAPNAAWFHATNSQPSFTIPGLTPGATYNFQVGITGSKGQVVYTSIISQMAV